MRVLMTIQMDTEKANKAIEDQSLGKIMKSAIEPLKPETAFFGAQNGERTAFLVFDMEHPSRMPPICEPFFLKLGAKINILPVMDFNDVQTGLQALASS